MLSYGWWERPPEYDDPPEGCLNCGTCESCINQSIEFAREMNDMMHRECRPEVSSHPDDAEPIHITFQGHTLCLSEVDASWLAANIQREIREMARKEIASAVPLTVEQRQQLRVDDRVVVRMDHGHPVGDEVYTVRREPWRLGHGAWVIGLQGISGGYDLSRVIGIVSTVHSRGPRA